MDDRAVMGEGLPIELMLEAAGRAVLDLVEELVPEATAIVVLAGRGGNGAGGITAARHALQRGREVRLIVPNERLGGPTAGALDLYKLFGGVYGEDPGDLEDCVVVDAMLGYSARGPPRAPFEGWLRDVQGVACTRLALDVPTGVGPGDGVLHDPWFAADHTLMLGVGKNGVLKAARKGHLGAVYLGDIGFPVGLDPRLDFLDGHFRSGRPVRVVV